MLVKRKAKTSRQKGLCRTLWAGEKTLEGKKDGGGELKQEGRSASGLFNREEKRESARSIQRVSSKCRKESRMTLYGARGTAKVYLGCDRGTN